LEHLDLDEEDERNPIDEQIAKRCQYQFSIIRMRDLREDSDISAETFAKFFQRLAFHPDSFLADFSEHRNIQGLTGLNFELKERAKGRKNSIFGSDLIDWLIDNTDIENREQGCYFGQILLMRKMLNSLNGETTFVDDKETIYLLPISGLRALFSKSSSFTSETGPDPQEESLHAEVLEDLAGLHTKTLDAKKDLLIKIIENPKFCSVFQDYLKSIYCSENLDFYFAVVEYRKLFEDGGTKCTSMKLTKSFCENLWKLYLENDDLNVPDGVKREIRKKLDADNFEYTLWDAMVGHTFQMMINDSFAKFLKSPAYKEIQPKLLVLVMGSGSRKSSDSLRPRSMTDRKANDSRRFDSNPAIRSASNSKSNTSLS
jgi:hypothetical protein